MAQRPTGFVASNDRFDEEEFNETGYTYIDNYLSNEIFRKIHGTLTGSAAYSVSPVEIAANHWLEQFDWHFGPGVVGKEITGRPEDQHIYFSTLLYFGTPFSKWFPRIAGPLMERSPNLRQLQRVKLISIHVIQLFLNTPHTMTIRGKTPRGHCSWSMHVMDIPNSMMGQK